MNNQILEEKNKKIINSFLKKIINNLNWKRNLTNNRFRWMGLSTMGKWVYLTENEFIVVVKKLTTNEKPPQYFRIAFDYSNSNNKTKDIKEWLKKKLIND